MSYTPQSSNMSVSEKGPSHSLDSLSTEEFLRVVGQRVRNQRSAMSMSRKRLAEVSGVSERYLAQLESGQGNMSIALLRKVTTAVDMSLASLLSADTPELDNDDDSTADSSSNVVMGEASNSQSSVAESRVFRDSDRGAEQSSSNNFVPEL